MEVLERPSTLPDNVESILGEMLDHLEQPRSHGRIIVERALGAIAAARHGLTEDELLDVLSADHEVMNYFYSQSPTERVKLAADRITHLPVVIWSRLYADLKPYMSQRPADGTIVLNLYHRVVGKVAYDRYLGSDISSRHAAIVVLAPTFSALLVRVSGGNGRSPP